VGDLGDFENAEMEAPEAEEQKEKGEIINTDLKSEDSESEVLSGQLSACHLQKVQKTGSLPQVPVFSSPL
jgi:hypothetical protein